MNIKKLSDEIGPEAIYEFKLPNNVSGVIVLDNSNLGPTIGGVRINDSGSVEKDFMLARRMTLKCALAGINYGGAKTTIIYDRQKTDAHPEFRKEIMTQFAEKVLSRFAHEDPNDPTSKPVYIPGPDMGTSESDMDLIYAITGVASGRSPEKGGIPIDKLGFTAQGMVAGLEKFMEQGIVDFDLEGAKISIEGFGNVGRPFAELLQKKGATIVGVSDANGMVYNGSGLDLHELSIAKDTYGSSSFLQVYEKLDSSATFDADPLNLHKLESDIFAPAATQNTVNMDNVGTLNTKLIIEGANNPVSVEAENFLYYKKGIISIPDFLINSGGLIGCVSDVEGLSADDALERVLNTVPIQTKAVFDRVTSGDQQLTPRKVAEDLALERVFQERTNKTMEHVP